MRELSSFLAQNVSFGQQWGASEKNPGPGPGSGPDLSVNGLRKGKIVWKEGGNPWK
jgi:hypothetical protein